MLVSNEVFSEVSAKLVFKGDTLEGNVLGAVPYDGNRTATVSVEIAPKDLQALQSLVKELVEKYAPEVARRATIAAHEAALVSARLDK